MFLFMLTSSKLQKVNYLSVYLSPKSDDFNLDVTRMAKSLEYIDHYYWIYIKQNTKKSNDKTLVHV